MTVEGSTLEPIPVPIQDLALRCWQERLVVCAGAGISMPSGLPSGGAVAERLADRLRALGHGDAINECRDDDLLCLADSMEPLPGGEDLVQDLLPATANYTTADPNHSHITLALLVMDALAPVALTNWDTCIERSAPGGVHIQAVVTDADRATVGGPRLFKVHGCASRQGSLLVSTAQLANPPTWVLHEIGARLNDSTVVFLGLGSIPGYVFVRVQQLLNAIPDSRQVIVVSREITQAWGELLGEHVEEQSLPLSAAEFLHQLLRGIVRCLFMEVTERARDHGEAGHFAGLVPDVVNAVRILIETLERAEPGRFISWIRSSAFDWQPDESVLRSEETKKALVAIALLARGQAEFDGRGPIAIDARKLQVLFVRGVVGSEIASRVNRRIEIDRAEGRIRRDEEVLVLAAGHQGPLPVQAHDIIENPDPASIVDGPRAGRETYYSVEDILQERFPQGWTE